MDGGRENGFLEDEEFGSEEEPDGQLLLEIIRKEEDRDLRQLVKRFRDQCQHHLVLDITSKADLGWGEQQDRSVIDYLDDPEKVALFVSPLQKQKKVGDRLRFDWAVVGKILKPNQPVCFFIKIETINEPLIRPGQFDAVISEMMVEAPRQKSDRVSSVSSTRSSASRNPEEKMDWESAEPKELPREPTPISRPLEIPIF